MEAAPDPWVELGPPGRFVTGDMTKSFPYHQPAWPVHGGAASCSAVAPTTIADAPALSGDWKKAEVETLLQYDLLGQNRQAACRDLGAVQRCRSGQCPQISGVDPASTISWRTPADKLCGLASVGEFHTQITMIGANQDVEANQTTEASQIEANQITEVSQIEANQITIIGIAAGAVVGGVLLTGSSLLFVQFKRNQPETFEV